jgi:hypothetical protein
MSKRLVARLLAIALVALPAGLALASDAHRKAQQMDADPLGYVNHLRLMRHEGTLYHYFGTLFTIAIAYFVVEGIALLLERVLNRAAPAA